MVRPPNPGDQTLYYAASTPRREHVLARFSLNAQLSTKAHISLGNIGYSARKEPGGPL
jgi:hypothetical protein